MKIRLLDLCLLSAFFLPIPQNDIALLRLRRPANVGSKKSVSPICLPKDENFEDEDLGEVFVAGWGLISDQASGTKSLPCYKKK